MKNHPLVNTFLTLRGNPRACVFTEPLWFIPYNLYLPFVSVYMAALGLGDSQIGLVASISTFFMAVFAMLSGAITDKLGRRLTTLIFDTLGWSVPSLLWALSQNFWWFALAAAFNGMMQVTATSWTCLLVEDAPRKLLIRIFTLLHLIGQLAVIFSPLAAIMVSLFSLVPVMRVIYAATCVSMTTKFVLLYVKSTETEVGKVRRSETRGISIFRILKGYSGIFRRITSSRKMLLALTISAIVGIVAMVSGNFFAIYATGPLEIPVHLLAYFPIARSLIIVIFVLFVQSHLMRLGFKRPMLAGVILYLAGHAVLLVAPPQNLPMLFAYVLIDACAFSLVTPNKDSLLATMIDPDERARISSIINSLVLCSGIPFGYLAGFISDIDRRLPFLLNIGFFAVLLVLIGFCGKLMDDKRQISG